MRKLTRREINRLIMSELSSMEEDVLKPFPQGKEKHHTPPLGSSTSRLKTHGCSVHGSVYEKDCLECGAMYEEELEKQQLNEGDCGCASTSSYPVGDMKKFDDIDYKGIMNSVLRLDAMHDGHDHFVTKHHRGGAYMAKSQLYKVEEYSKKLYDMIPDGYNLEDWMRTKISQISDDMSEVYHALKHDKFKGKI